MGIESLPPFPVDRSEEPSQGERHASSISYSPWERTGLAIVIGLLAIVAFMTVLLFLLAMGGPSWVP